MLAARIRKHPRLRRIPVIVMSSSSSPREIDQVYDAGANSYLVKPSEIEGLVEVFQAIQQFSSFG
jgi:CheY-like chemotaxis protein